MSENVQSAETPQKSGAVKELVEIVKTIVYALAIALFLRVLFFQPFTIPSASMEPNLYEGDYIIVNDHLDKAVDQVKAIYTAEQCKTKRLRDLLKQFME